MWPPPGQVARAGCCSGRVCRRRPLGAAPPQPSGRWRSGCGARGGAPVLMNRSGNEVSDLSRCLSVWPASAGSSPGCRPERATEAARRWPRTIVPSSFLVQDADRQKSHIWTIPRSLLVMEIIYFTTGKALRCRRCRNTYAVNGPRLGQRCSFLIGCT